MDSDKNDCLMEEDKAVIVDILDIFRNVVEISSTINFVVVIRALRCAFEVVQFLCPVVQLCY